MQWDVQEEWDSLDLLAAIGQAATLLAQVDARLVTLHQREAALRLTCLWDYVTARFSIVPTHIPTPSPTHLRAHLRPRAVAEQWRAHGWFDELAEKDRSWLVRQMLIEVGAAWEALGALLTADVPEAARLLRWASVSPQTALLF